MLWKFEDFGIQDKKLRLPLQKDNFQKITELKILTLPSRFNLISNFLIMGKGTVKFFNDSKGYGFITEEGSNTDHFVHISGLIDEVREGDVVEYELQQGKKGLNAVNVKVVE